MCNAIVGIEIKWCTKKLVREDFSQRIDKFVLSVRPHRQSLVDDNFQESPPIMQPARRNDSKAGARHRPRSVPFGIRVHQSLRRTVADEKDNRGRPALDEEWTSDEGFRVFSPQSAKK